jgi:solute carrier family 12 sodium/potassium/chloride transporter 2
MFVISWIMALVTFAFLAILYIYIRRRKPGLCPLCLRRSLMYTLPVFADVNWGSSSQATVYQDTLVNMLQLQRTNEHVKNYRPQILVQTG